MLKKNMLLKQFLNCNFVKQILLEKQFIVININRRIFHLTCKKYVNNLGCHNLVTGSAYMNLYDWDKDVVSSGSREIATCFIEDLWNITSTSHVDQFIIFSNSCDGQKTSIKLSCAVTKFIGSAESPKKPETDVKKT